MRSMPRLQVYAFAATLVATSLSAAPATHVPKTNTRAAVQAYVEEAAKVVQKNGPSCAAFASPSWESGDYYIFVADAAGKTLCHPRKELVGTSIDAIVNAHGDKVGEKINRMAIGNGKGWVDYLWARPGKKTEELKSSYVMGVVGPDHRHYVVGAGAWDLK